MTDLGTSAAKEAKEYFSNMDRHRIIFKYESIKDDFPIQIALNCTCLHDGGGGGDAASAHYICTQLNVLLIDAHDIEISYSTDIPSYNPLTLSNNNMKYYIKQECEQQHQLNNPISQPKQYPDNYDDIRAVINDVCTKLDGTSVEITNLLIIRVVVQLSLAAQFAKFNQSDFYKSFHLQQTFKLTNVVLFDHNAEEIISFGKDASGVIPTKYQKGNLSIIVGHSFDGHSYCTSFNINNSEEDRYDIPMSNFIVDRKLVNPQGSCGASGWINTSTTVSCTDYSVNADLSTGEQYYLFPINGNNLFSIGFVSGFWMSNLAIGNGTGWSIISRVNTFVRLDGFLNRSPVATTLPIIYKEVKEQLFDDRIAPGAISGSAYCGKFLHNRYGGCKDTLSVDPKLDGQQYRLVIWDSMNKFNSDHDILELFDTGYSCILKYEKGVAKGVPIARNAGSLSPLASKFDRQRVLAIDQYNNIYVTDTFYHRIQKWGPNDSDGTTIAGGTRNGKGVNQLFFSG
ncbi:unnamed protein product [Rotaria sp. Silwood1]|nr:unnamed protein product [Rotaria sp. Silwood1]